ncbi:alpha/beta-hydrolase lipase region domain-containing protein [Phthorimaea operculella]|nr:alpha/beta-hydrolase lipase region domain-containing protein [Phthorimaea operculella]
MNDGAFYIKNFLESRAAIPTLEEDFILTNAKALQFLTTNFDTYNVPDSYLNISQLVEKNGFPFERHFVTTEDGYILQLHRIPGKGPVVFLNHGILLSSVDFVVGGANGSLAFYLARRGYDVWMGNARGNRFSRRNLYISPVDQPQFFNFSWHEIGIYDLPATIDYILKLTGETALNYVGYSQGQALTFGYDRGELNFTNIPVILNHAFAGSSTKQFQHYGQNIYSGKFRQYDYGKAGNLELYGTVEPPDYPLHKVTAPVVLSYSFSDYFSSVIDVLELKKHLPNVVGLFEAKYFSHVDYVYGRDTDDEVNSKVVQFIKRFAHNDSEKNDKS